MPFARATGIGSTAACADHSNSVCRRQSSPISSPVNGLESLAMFLAVVGIVRECYSNTKPLTTSVRTQNSGDRRKHIPFEQKKTFAKLRPLFAFSIDQFLDQRPFKAVIVKVKHLVLVQFLLQVGNRIVVAVIERARR